MRIVSILLPAFLLALFTLQCTGPTGPDPYNEPPHTSPEITDADKQLVNSTNQFGFKLFREINESEATDKNIFVSPLSVSFALGMTYNGADGETRDAMAATLELAGLSPEEINRSYRHVIDVLSQLDPAVAFAIANSIWYRDGFPISPEFVDLNRTYFDALVRGLDFGQSWAADTINHWVDANTNGKITEIINPPIPIETVMYLINAIHFKGDWTLPFDTGSTKNRVFTRADGSKIERPIMQTDTLLQYFENDLFQAVDLPYGNGDFSMAVLLPRYGYTPDDIIAQMTPEYWAVLVESFSDTGLQLGLPKFRFEYEKSLNDVLQSMGMAIAFAMGGADFGNMVTDMAMLPGNLYISNVKHKSFVQVDEIGTEAAAVTVVEIGVTSMEKVLMLATRPFVFVIHEHETGSILFMGKIVDPVWEE